MWNRQVSIPLALFLCTKHLPSILPPFASTQVPASASAFDRKPGTVSNVSSLIYIDNCLGHQHFCGVPAIFINVENTRLQIAEGVFHFCSAIFFCKISLTQCKLFPVRLVSKRIWSPVVYLRYSRVYSEFWSVFITKEKEIHNKKIYEPTDQQSV